MDAVSMDTQMDVQASEEAEREAVRLRAEEALAEVAALLAQPRDPEVVRRAAEWQREHEARKAEEQRHAPPSRREEARPQGAHDAAPATRPVPSVRGGYGHTPVTYQILEEAMRKLVNDERSRRKEAILDALKVVADRLNEDHEEMWKTFAAARTKTTWRFEEAERRVAELEARLAKLEGRTDG